MRWVTLAIVLVGCGGSATPVEHAAETSVAPEAPAPPLAREGTIARAELDAILADGMGRFLQSLSVEPHIEDGRFVGHRVTELRGSWYAGVDLRPGDTLLSINGLPIERPEEAMLAFDGLRVASELTVEYLRAGERRQLRFAIE